MSSVRACIHNKDSARILPLRDGTQNALREMVGLSAATLQVARANRNAKGPMLARLSPSHRPCSPLSFVRSRGGKKKKKASGGRRSAAIGVRGIGHHVADETRDARLREPRGPITALITHFVCSILSVVQSLRPGPLPNPPTFPHMTGFPPITPAEVPMPCFAGVIVRLGCVWTALPLTTSLKGNICLDEDAQIAKSRRRAGQR